MCSLPNGLILHFCETDIDLDDIEEEELDSGVIKKEHVVAVDGDAEKQIKKELLDLEDWLAQQQQALVEDWPQPVVLCAAETRQALVDLAVSQYDQGFDDDASREFT